MVETGVRAVGIDATTGQAVLVLEESAGEHRMLVVAVGEAEAVAAARALEQLPTRRPDTHSLIGAVLAAAGRRVERVRVHELREQVFHAELQLDDGTRIDARASDAVVLALHARAPIEVAEEVLAVAGVGPDAVAVEGAGRGTAEVEELRRFLDTAVPDDFRPEG